MGRWSVPTAGILHPDRILEVVVEAAVVEVYGTHHGLAVIHHKDLRVDEAGQPLAYIRMQHLPGG